MALALSPRADVRVIVRSLLKQIPGLDPCAPMATAVEMSARITAALVEAGGTGFYLTANPVAHQRVELRFSADVTTAPQLAALPAGCTMTPSASSPRVTLRAIVDLACKPRGCADA